MGAMLQGVVGEMAPGLYVRYVGKTPTYPDVLFGTGEWARGQVKHVVAGVALRMFQHPDQYQQAPSPEGVDASQTGALGQEEKRADLEPDTPEQEAEFAVRQMDVAAVKDFISSNFNIKADGRKGVDALRAQAVQLINQFGINQ